MFPEPRPAFLDDRGMTTEYALLTLVSAALAAAMFLIVTSDDVRNALAELVQRALSLED